MEHDNRLLGLLARDQETRKYLEKEASRPLNKILFWLMISPLLLIFGTIFFGILYLIFGS